MPVLSTCYACRPICVHARDTTKRRQRLHPHQYKGCRHLSCDWFGDRCAQAECGVSFHRRGFTDPEAKQELMFWLGMPRATKKRSISHLSCCIPVPRFHTLGLYAPQRMWSGLRYLRIIIADPWWESLSSLSSFKPQWQVALRHGCLPGVEAEQQLPPRPGLIYGRCLAAWLDGSDQHSETNDVSCKIGPGDIPCSLTPFALGLAHHHLGFLCQGSPRTPRGSQVVCLNKKELRSTPLPLRRPRRVGGTCYISSLGRPFLPVVFPWASIPVVGSRSTGHRKHLRHLQGTWLSSTNQAPI